MNHINMTVFSRSLELLVHQHTPLSYTNRGHRGVLLKNAISAFLPSPRPNQTGAVVSELANTVQHRRCGSLAGVSAAETNELHLTILQHYHTHLILHSKATERSSNGLCVCLCFLSHHASTIAKLPDGLSVTNHLYRSEKRQYLELIVLLDIGA